MLRQAAGMIGAALSEAQGTGVVPPTGKAAVHDAVDLAAVERFGDVGASPGSSTAPVGGSPGLVMRGSASGMEMDRLLDMLGSVKDQLGRLERRQFESEASIMKQPCAISIVASGPTLEWVAPRGRRRVSASSGIRRSRRSSPATETRRWPRTFCSIRWTAKREGAVGEEHRRACCSKCWPRDGVTRPGSLCDSARLLDAPIAGKVAARRLA